MSELYLKDEKVLTLKDIDGVPSEIQRIDAPELLPVYLQKSCTYIDFKEWMKHRSMPESRENRDLVIAEHGKSWLENKNYASLTDQYWIKKRTETWKKINFFTNTYSKQVGDMFFLPWTIQKQRKYDGNSPDLTTGGTLMKRWGQNTDKSSYLVKAGSMISHQEPLSEVLVSVMAERLHIVPCVKYDMCIEGVTICCRCDNIANIDTELVPAYHIYNVEEKKDNESVYTHLLKMCEKHDIPDVEEFLDAMICMDRLTGNEDRNLSNIAFLRDSNTMKFLGPAPLFDSGNAFWSVKRINEHIKSKMFGDIEKQVFEKIKKKHDFTPITKNSEFEKVISKYPGITDEKKEQLITAINKRNEKLLEERSPSIER